MLKKLLIGLLTLLIITYAAARSLLPEKLDRQHNPVVFAAPYKVSNEVNQFYQSIDFIADLHGDTLLWKRDILKEHDYGHLDLPRLQQANVAMQFFTIVNKVPENLNFDKNDDTTDQLTIPFLLQGRSASDLSERVLEQAGELHQYSKDSNGQLVVVTNKKELQSFISQRKNNKQLTSGLLGIEGGQALEGDIKILDKFYDAGIRMIGLTHFFDNEIGGSAHGVNKGGITEFGKQVVKAMEAKNMLVDLSHASPKLIDDVLAMVTKPVMVSHTGVKGTCKSPRNLSDDHLKQIAKTGGIVGIGFFKPAVCADTVESIAETIVYTVNLIGAEHVSLGSDFDGSIKAIVEVRGLPLIAGELQKRGLTNEQIRLVMGGNVKRFFSENLPD